MAGLIAAYYAIKAGHTVTVLEEGHHGGAVQQQVIETAQGPIGVDAGAEAYAARSARLDEIIDDLGLTDEIVTPNPAGSWLYLPDLGAVLAPKLGMWGIPGDPRAHEVVAALGPEAAARAAQELELPMDDWATRRAAGESITVGELVADRFGDVVVERLVAPVVAGVHSADPYDIDIDRIAPGLVDQAIERGSVAKAITTLRAAAPPGAAVKSLSGGGMSRLKDALVDYVSAHGRLEVGSKVVALDAQTRIVLVETGQTYQADHAVLAVDAPVVHDILSTLTPVSHRPALLQRPIYGAGVGLVIVAVDSAELDAHPRGTGMLVSPAATEVSAKAATHVTAKWAWVDQRAKETRKHRHIVRLSYGRVTDPFDGSAPGYQTNDDTLVRLAYADLAKMFGLDEQHVLDNVAGVETVRWRTSMPLTTPENAQRIAAIQDAVDDIDWLQLTGPWFAGTGLAAIAQHCSALSFNQVQ